MGEHPAGVLDRLFWAVSGRVRLAILARLADSEVQVTDVTRDFPISLNSSLSSVSRRRSCRQEPPSVALALALVGLGMLHRSAAHQPPG
jgi:hypothetical protein